MAKKSILSVENVLTQVDEQRKENAAEIEKKKLQKETTPDAADTPIEEEPVAHKKVTKTSSKPEESKIGSKYGEQTVPVQFFVDKNMKRRLAMVKIDTGKQYREIAFLALEEYMNKHHPE